jgi:hypothetical protein
LPEFLISANDFWLGKRSLVLSSRPDTFAVEDLTRHAQAWRRDIRFQTERRLVRGKDQPATWVDKDSWRPVVA